MKLSELIAFRDKLDEFTVQGVKANTRYNLDNVIHRASNPADESLVPIVAPYIDKLREQENEIYQAFDRLNASFGEIRKDLQDQISKQEQFWFQESYKIFEEAETCEKTEQILYNRKSSGTDRTDATLEIVRAKLLTHADWKYPGIIIRPGVESFIEDMVGYDPLYIVDRDHDLLSPCKTKFPKLYQTRLRSYTTNDWSDEPILKQIPENQFGICLAYNVFNYRPLEIIRRYLTEIYSKLRPGGILLMTYNDCDRVGAVRLVERYSTSYTPGYLIRDLADSIGFHIKQTWDDGGPSVWLELEKPGVLVSHRGGQVISALKDLEWIDDDVDFILRKTYNKEEIEFLHEQAKFFDIDQSTIQNIKPGELKLLIREKEAERQARLKLQYYKEVALENNISTSEPDWEQRVEDFLTEKKNRELREAEERRIAHLKNLAIENNIDVTTDSWLDDIKELLRKKEEEQRLHEEMLERKRIQELHNRAKTFGMDPLEYPNETMLTNELNRRVAEEDDKQRKQELVLLRQRAMELQAGDPNLIRYGYSAEKLKQLIKAKEEGQ